MSSTFNLGSATITITDYPIAKNPKFEAEYVFFDSSPIEAMGEVELTGDVGDTAVGWTLGFIQVNWVHTEWYCYRGQLEAAGSIFLQGGKPHRACRDTYPNVPASGVWFRPHNNTTLKGNADVPCRIFADFLDCPWRKIPVVQVNKVTGDVNFLSEAQIEFHFCTVLALLDPGGMFHQLRHFYWNVHWQARFHPTFDRAANARWSVTPVGKGYTATKNSPIYQGEVTDHRFRTLVTGAAHRSCNQIAKSFLEKLDESGFAGRTETDDWRNFDVRQ